MEAKQIVICAEGVYSADGNFGNIAGIVTLAKRFGAQVLVDEAHSILLTGTNGRGICDEQSVLGDIDYLVLTFSKGFGGIGGAVLAKIPAISIFMPNAGCSHAPGLPE